MNKILTMLSILWSSIAIAQQLPNDTRLINMRGDTFDLAQYRPSDRLILVFNSGEACTACKESIGHFLNDSITIDTSKVRIVGITNYAHSFQYMRSAKSIFRAFCPNTDQVFFDFRKSDTVSRSQLINAFDIKHMPCIILLDRQRKFVKYLSYTELFSYVFLSSESKRAIKDFIK